MRILVTGVTGRIGGNLAATLAGAGHEVRGLVWARDARTAKLAGLGLELVEGTLTDRPAIDRAVEGVEAVAGLDHVTLDGQRATAQRGSDRRQWRVRERGVRTPWHVRDHTGRVRLDDC